VSVASASLFILALPSNSKGGLIKTNEMDEPYLSSSANITLVTQSALLFMYTNPLASGFSQHVQLLVSFWAADSGSRPPFSSRTGAGRLSTQGVRMVERSNLKCSEHWGPGGTNIIQARPNRDRMGISITTYRGRAG
jgi:hypothetical protein